MAKVTLFEFTRNMMQQLEGDTLYVDLGNDRGGRADRVEPSAAGTRKDPADENNRMGEGEVGDVVWPEIDYRDFYKAYPLRQPCPGCGRMINIHVEGCWCEVEKADAKERELEAERAFFNGARQL